MTTSFVGRRHELGILDACLDSARAGIPRTTLVEGAPGLGKSALVAAFVESHGDAMPLVVTGDETETDLDFGLVNQLIATDASTWLDHFSAGADLLQLL